MVSSSSGSAMVDWAAVRGAGSGWPRKGSCAREGSLALPFIGKGGGGGQAGRARAGEGATARGWHDLDAWFGHGDGVASRGACQPCGVPGRAGFGAKPGARGGLAGGATRGRHTMLP
jgi:hypothetical protein